MRRVSWFGLDGGSEGAREAIGVLLLWQPIMGLDGVPIKRKTAAPKGAAALTQVHEPNVQRE
jgi:hypothetical protein